MARYMYIRSFPTTQPKNIHYILPLFFLFFASSDGLVEVELGFPGFIDPATGSVAMPFTGPAFEIAIDLVNEMYAGILNFTMTYCPLTDGSYKGNATEVVDWSTYLVSDWYYRKRIFPDGIPVILSSGTLDYGQVHQLSAEWNILWFQTVLFAKSGYTLPGPPMLATSVTSPPAIMRTFITFMNLHNWSTVFAAVDSINSPFYFTVLFNELVKAFAVNPNFTVYLRRIAAGSYEGDGLSYKPLFDEFQICSRVFIYLTHPDHMRLFMLDAASNNMTSGEFVFVTFGSHFSLPVSRWGNLTWRMDDSNDQVARQAFKTLFVVQEFKDPVTVDTDPFLAEIRRRAVAEFGISFRKQDQTVHDLLACHLTITTLAQVLNESLASDGEAFLHDTVALSQRFLGRTFHDHFSQMYLDPGGDRSSRQAVAYFTGDEARRTLFMLERPRTYDLEVLVNFSSYWPGPTWPPANEPLCGFRHDKSVCDARRQNAMISLLSLVGLIGILVLAFHFMNYSMRRRSMDIWWRLEAGNSPVAIERKALYRSAAMVRALTHEKLGSMSKVPQ